MNPEARRSALIQPWWHSGTSRYRKSLAGLGGPADAGHDVPDPRSHRLAGKSG